MLKTYVCPYCGEYHEATTFELETQTTYECTFCMSTVKLDGNEFDEKEAFDSAVESFNQELDNIQYLTESGFDDYLYY